MATRARFGRLPRAAPSLTSTIVALAQEYQNVRDRNIEDAWKNGGLFEGKKVTDKMFLDHWKTRLGEVSPDDPMWDYYNNLISQTEFSIEESKMGQKYAEEKVSEAEMAAFYRKWAAKLPTDSEAYRQLMTQAAKFKAAAGARSRGSSAQAKAAAYERAQQDTYNKYEAAYDVATTLLAQYAQSKNLLDVVDLNDPDGGWSKLTTAAGGNDPLNFANLLSDLMADPDLKAQFTAAVRRADPNFSGDFTDESLANLANTASNGARIRENRANVMGDSSGANHAAQKAANYGMTEMVIRATLGTNAQAGFVSQNERERARMDDILAPNSGASPAERQAATKRYRDWLANVGVPYMANQFPAASLDPFSESYDPFAAGLIARTKGTLDALDGKPTGMTLKDDIFGLSGEDPGQDSDAYRLGMSTSMLNSEMEQVNKGAAIVVKINDEGKIDPSGRNWGIFRKDDPDVTNRELVPYSVPNSEMATGGEIRYVPSVPVRVQVYGGYDPNTGKGTMPLKTDPTVDPMGPTRAVIQLGGMEVVVWSVMHNGTRVWTKDSPFSEMNKGEEHMNEDGEWVVGYVEPQTGKGPMPTVKPSGYINFDLAKRNVNGIDSTDGKPWDPQVDKEMGFISPWQAAAASSSEAAKYIALMPTTLIQQNEREWFSKTENWSPEMKAQAAQGVDPKIIVESASNRLVHDLQMMQRYGFTPEDQQATRARIVEHYTNIRAEAAGLTVPEYRERNVRNDLASQLAKWGEQRTAYGTPTIHPETGKVLGTAGTQAAAWAKKGWTPATLLNQPGMSAAQASDLVNQITGGALGQRLGPEPVQPGVPRKNQLQGILGKPKHQPNPFAANALLGGGAVIKPNPVKPGLPSGHPTTKINPVNTATPVPLPFTVSSDGKKKAGFGNVKPATPTWTPSIPLGKYEQLRDL